MRRQTHAGQTSQNCPHRRRRFNNGVGLIPLGEYMRGSANGDADERPVQHDHHQWRRLLSVATRSHRRQWQTVMGNNPSFFIGDDLPVEQRPPRPRR